MEGIFTRGVMFWNSASFIQFAVPDDARLLRRPPHATRPTAASGATRRVWGIPRCCDELVQKADSLVCQKRLEHPLVAKPACSCRPCFDSSRALLNLHPKTQGRGREARGIKSKGFDIHLLAQRKMSCRLERNLSATKSRCPDCPCDRR